MHSHCHLQLYLCLNGILSSDSCAAILMSVRDGCHGSILSRTSDNFTADSPLSRPILRRFTYFMSGIFLMLDLDLAGVICECYAYFIPLSPLAGTIYVGVSPS